MGLGTPLGRIQSTCSCTHTRSKGTGNWQVWVQVQPKMPRGYLCQSLDILQARLDSPLDLQGKLDYQWTQLIDGSHSLCVLIIRGAAPTWGTTIVLSTCVTLFRMDSR